MRTGTHSGKRWAGLLAETPLAVGGSRAQEVTTRGTWPYPDIAGVGPLHERFEGAVPANPFEKVSASGTVTPTEPS